MMCLQLMGECGVTTMAVMMWVDGRMMDRWVDGWTDGWMKDSGKGRRKGRAILPKAYFNGG